MSTSISVVAKLLLLTERRIQQLASEGAILKNPDGKYDLGNAIAGYVRYLTERLSSREPKSKNELEVQNYRARLQKANILKAELELKNTDAKFIPLIKIRDDWKNLVEIFQNKIKDLIANVVIIVAESEGFYETQTQLQKIIHEALTLLADSKSKISQVLLRALLPPKVLTVSSWAYEHRFLSSESSSEPGRWSNDRAPYQQEIMDSHLNPKVRELVIMSSAQVGKTEILNNIIGYHIHLDPAPMLLLQPTLEMAESWSKERFAPMIRDSSALAALVKDPRSRDSGNTLLHKLFPGGHISVVGANSPASLASRPIRVVLCDEVDRYPASSGTEGDPIALAKKRTVTFKNRKLVLASTPTIKNLSRIEAAYLMSDQRRYYVPCPHCNQYQTLKWAQITFEEAKPDTACYICEHCQMRIYEAHKVWMLSKGYWKAESKFTGIAGFHLSELYSPWVTFSQMVTEFLQAKLLPETLKTWINTALGESFEEDGEVIDADLLFARREDFGALVPREVLVITCGVDVQGDRIEVETKGWGVGEESWSVDFRIFFGNPHEYQIWQDLDEYLAKPIKSVNGINLSISCAFIDSGGHHTQGVYEFCQLRAGRNTFAIKGMAEKSKPIVGRALKNARNIRLYPIGVDTAKEVIYGRLKLVTPGPGYMHFPKTHDIEYFRQLTSEKQVTKFVKGVVKRAWIKTRSRNEALDCTVYALAALKLLNPDFAELAANMDEQKHDYAQVTRDHAWVKWSDKYQQPWIPKMNNWLA